MRSLLPLTLVIVAACAAPEPACGGADVDWARASGAMATLVASDDGDLVVGTDVLERLGPDGVPIWVRDFGASRFALGAGSIAIAGQFSVSLDVGDVHLTTSSASEGFVVVLTNDGTAVAGATLGALVPQAIALGNDGTVLVTGMQPGALDLGTGPLASQPGLALVALATETVPTGLHALWAHDLSAAESGDSSSAIVIDHDTALVAFALEGTSDLDGHPITSAGMSDVAIARFAVSGGAVVASARFGGADDDAHQGYLGDPLGLAVSADGASIAISTAARADTDYGDGLLALQGGGADAALLVLDADFSLRFARMLGGPGFDAPGAVAIGRDGAIAMVGTTGHATTDGPFACSGTSALPIVVLDHEGSLRGWECFPADDLVAGLAVALPADGSVLVSGFTTAPFTLGTVPITRGFVASFRLHCR